MHEMFLARLVILTGICQFCYRWSNCIKYLNFVGHRLRIIGKIFKDFPHAVVGLIETLLAVDPAHRGTAAFALKSEFFTVEPQACDPTTLPKYPPSKEIDAKLRSEEARRLGAGIKEDKIERDMRGSKDSRVVPAPNANAELAMSLQDEAASGFSIVPGPSLMMSGLRLLDIEKFM